MTAGGKRHLGGWRRDRPAPPGRDRVDWGQNLSTPPPAASLRDKCPPVRDQGGLGSCVANAVLEAAGFLYTKAGHSDPMLSRLDLYYYTRVMEGTPPTEDAGCEISDAASVLESRGCPREVTWPYDESRFDEQPPPEADAEAPHHKALLSIRLPNLRTLKSSIAQGFPPVIGFPVPENMESNECARTGIVNYPAPGEGFVGGHAVLAAAYDDAVGWVGCQNSWGTGWGDRGWLWLPYRYFDEGLATDMRTIRLELQEPDVAKKTTIVFSETKASPVNPERGFYSGIDLINGSTKSAAAIRSAGRSLAYAPVRLDPYRASPIDQSFLDKLHAGFSRAAGAGIKVILRHVYNDSRADDAPKSQILQHIGQLAPVWQRNADVIAVMQAGFIGAWGEWHSSTHGLDNPTDRADILNAILNALPPSRSVQVRTPMFKAALYPTPLMENEAFTGTFRARIGHHNDCFLASATDMGTYDAPVATWEEYVAKDGLYTPVGGETCALNAPRTDCAGAMAEMEANHWSFANSEYNKAVIGTWIVGGCYVELEKRLGYRFVLEEVHYDPAPVAGGVFALELAVFNRGFAAMFNARPLLVTFTGEARHVVDLDVDARRWRPGVSTTFSAQIRLPAEMIPGTYAVGLWLPDEAAALRDDARYAVQLANDGLWREFSGENVIIPELQVGDGT